MALATKTQIDRLTEQVGDLLEERTGGFDRERYVRYADDPVGFITDVLDGERIWSKQVEIAESVRDHPFTVVRSCNSAGKDWLAARIALWWVYARGGFVLMSGPTERQVKEILMQKEVATAFRRAEDLPGDLYQLSLRVTSDDKTGILALTSSEASRITGFHAPRVLVVLTEAQACESFVYEGLRSCATGEEDRFLALGNPLSPEGPFYRFSKPGSGWNAIRIRASEHPNVVHDDPSLIPGGVTCRWIEDTERDYGRGSDVCLSRIEGEFPETADNVLVKRSWLDAAAERWANGDLEAEAVNVPHTAALDPARFGPDRSALAIRQGPILRELITWGKLDLMEMCGHVIRTLQERNLGPMSPTLYGPGVGGKALTLIIDEIGLGSGVHDRLKEQDWPVVGFNGANRAQQPERFINRRAESYWRLRKLLEGGDVAVPPDDDLFDELLSIQWGVDSSGKIKLERKDETKLRLGRSPDRADAVAMAFGSVTETATIGAEMIDL